MPEASVPPPEPARTGASAGIPYVVVALIAALVAGGLYAVDRIGVVRAGPTVERFVPPDGASWTERINTDTAVTESAIIVGAAVVSAADWTVATRLIGTAGADRERLARGRYWRTTTTIPARSGRESQLIKVYRADTELALMVESGPNGAFAYTPNLVELPADAQPGATWTSRGNAGGTISYVATLRADAAAEECLLVTGSIRYSAPGLGALDRPVKRTWCPGRGLVSVAEGSVGLSSTITRLDPTTTLPRLDSTEQGVAWRPASWRGRTAESTSADPTFGTGPVSGTPGGQPALTRSGVLLRATTSSQDVLGLTPASDGTWRSRWRVHPGGSVLTLAAFGDTFVVTTSERQVVGYGADGARRWAYALPEVVLVAPVRAGPREAVLVTLGGEVVVFDVTTGAVRWRTTPGSDVGVAPTVTADLVFVADRAGTVTAVRLADGSRAWQARALEVRGLVATGDLVVAVRPNDVDGFAAADGRRRWRRSFPDNARLAAPYGADGVAVTTNTGVQGLDGSGRPVWSRSGADGVTGAAGFVVCWGSEQAEVVGPGGRTVLRFPVPPATVGNARRFLTAPDGVWLLDSTWTIRRWDGG